MLNNWQQQILQGTVLGGSCLVRPKNGLSHHLRMSGKDPNWLAYKAEELAPLFPDATPHKENGTYRLLSVTDPALTELHARLFDGDGRRISDDVLNLLQDIGLAVWFLDAGAKTGRNNRNAYMSATMYGLDGAEIIREYFATIDCECKVCVFGKRIRILFSVDGTDQLLKIIAPTFPEFMHHRL